MADNRYGLFGVHAIRLFIWGKLQSELGFKRSDYRGAVPIVTPGQQPEFNDYSAPYIVYSFTTSSMSEDWLMREEQAGFRVYGGDEAEIRQVIGMLGEMFRAYDDSARLVNNWLASNSPLHYYTDTELVQALDEHGDPILDDEENPVLVKAGKGLPDFDFKSIRLTSLMGPEPALQESGRTYGVISISYKYTFPQKVEYGY